ncbi:unnamed protein product [Dovyalis caffra]|uniref:Uncharacterized protein n=1 Tax=Dovyalis caffra TaxID=77055 RepID=A0AAV1RIC5_9ROSI|nr:unnamed protein product [Dovyalis caffra]
MPWLGQDTNSDHIYCGHKRNDVMHNVVGQLRNPVSGANLHANSRKARNNINLLDNAASEKLTSMADIQGEITGFYQKLLGETDCNVNGRSVEYFKGVLKHHLADEQKQSLIAPITSDEIKMAIFALSGTNLPVLMATQLSSLRLHGG